MHFLTQISFDFAHIIIYKTDHLEEGPKTNNIITRRTVVESQQKCLILQLCERSELQKVQFFVIYLQKRSSFGKSQLLTGVKLANQNQKKKKNGGKIQN